MASGPTGVHSHQRRQHATHKCNRLNEVVQCKTACSWSLLLLHDTVGGVGHYFCCTIPWAVLVITSAARYRGRCWSLLLLHDTVGGVGHYFCCTIPWAVLVITSAARYRGRCTVGGQNASEMPCIVLYSYISFNL